MTEMANPSAHSRKSRNPNRVPWHLQGKEGYIAELREEKLLTFDEIGALVGCSGEGARVAYNRFLKQKSPQTSDKSGETGLAGSQSQLPKEPLSIDGSGRSDAAESGKAA